MTLQPWQKLPRVTCGRCGRQALRRVYVADITPVVRNGVMCADISGDAGIKAELACRHHADAIATEYVTEYDAVCSEPLRRPWSCWVRGLVLGCRH